MSEWKRDENGRYYRMIGENCKEYATDYIRCGAKPEPVEQQPKEPEKRCPFLRSVNDRCKGSECAFYVGEACVFAKASAQKPVRNTAGLRCPINKEARTCSEDCAVYNSGCMLTTILKKGEN